MLYEYKGKFYIKVSNRYYEVSVKKQSNGTFDVVPNKNKEYIENLERNTGYSYITLQEAYKKANKISDTLKNEID